jgi:hypothetical protein
MSKIENFSDGRLRNLTQKGPSDVRLRNLTQKGLGRPKGIPNKTTRQLKEAILLAAERAGDEEGVVGYLHRQAIANPVAFMGLLGKVLPLQTTGEGGGPLEIRWLPPQERPGAAAPPANGLRSPVAAKVVWPGPADGPQ